jgi:hypothetical protein
MLVKELKSVGLGSALTTLTCSGPAAVYPVVSALVIFVLVTCIVSVLAVHLFHAQDEWNFGPPCPRPLRT